LRFNRQKTQETDTETAPESGLGIRAKGPPVDVLQTVLENLFFSIFIRVQFETKGELSDVLIEPLPHPLCNLLGCQNNTDFGIMIDRPGIEVQGSDKDLFAIEDE